MIEIEIKNKSYGDKKIFYNFKLDIRKNKTSVILGPSGIGKTTLLNIISGLDDNYTGTVPQNIRSSYVFQEDRLIKWKTVKENIMFALGSEKVDEDKIEEILDMLNMRELENTVVKNLSGGQKQRVSISRAFIYPSKMILMDEPFKSLDIHLKVKILTDLEKLIKRENKTIVLVTHSIREALYLGDDIYIVKRSPIETYKKITLTDADKQEIRRSSQKMLEYEDLLYNEMAMG